MDFDSVLFDLLIKIVVALVLAAIPPLTAILVRIAFLKMKQISKKSDFGSDAFWLLNDFVKTSILAAEQTFDSNADKFEYAVEILISFADSFGFSLTEDQAEALIEGMVKSVKQGSTLALTPPPKEALTIVGTAEEFEI